MQLKHTSIGISHVMCTDLTRSYKAVNNLWIQVKTIQKVIENLFKKFTRFTKSTIYINWYILYTGKAIIFYTKSV